MSSNALKTQDLSFGSVNMKLSELLRQHSYVSTGIQAICTGLKSTPTQYRLLGLTFYFTHTRWLSGLLVAAVVVLAMLLGKLLDVRVILGSFIACGCGWFFLSQFVFSQGSVLLVLAPLLALGLVFIYQLVYGYALQALKKSRLRSTFKKYVDLKLVDVLVERGKTESNAVGRRKHIAVLLVDATITLFNGFVPLDGYVYKAAKAAWDMVQCAEEVNAAARVESNAKASQVLISRDVCELLEGRITADFIGEIPLKGNFFLLEVFALTGIV